MKLSENTVSVLKNFAGVNVNLVIQPGKVIRTIGASRNIFAKAEVEDEFPIQVCIYDLNSFLQVITFFPDADLDFQEKYVDTSFNDAVIRYFYADPSVVTAAPNKEVTLDEELFSCEMSLEDVNSLMKVAAALAAPTIILSSSGNKVTVVVTDKKNSSAHSYSKKLTAIKNKKEIPDFEAILRVENFKLLPGKYKCTVGRKVHKDNSSVGVIQWENQDTPLTYWMTVEQDSKI